MSTIEVEALPEHEQTALVAQPRKTFLSILRRIAESDLTKTLALVIVFTWLPLAAWKYAPFHDPDIWWHIRAGEWITQHHQLPVKDVFSATTAGKHEWINYSWPFDLLMYGLIKVWDLRGVLLYTGLSQCLLAVALFTFLRGLWPHFWRSAALTAAAVYASATCYGPRPGNITVTFFILLMHLLLSAERSQDAKRLWWIPALFCVWANLHVQFVYGLFVLGVFCIEPVLNWMLRYRDSQSTPVPNRQLWMVLAASCVATLVNPYGIAIYRVIFSFMGQKSLYNDITELQAMTFRIAGHYILLLLVIMAGIALGWSKKLRPLWVVLLVWSAMMGFRSTRDIWVTATICCAVIAGGKFRTRSEVARQGRHLTFATAGFTMAMLALGWSVLPPSNSRILNQVIGWFPVGSVAYIHEHHLQGPIYNGFTWGGFLSYALPEIPNLIDGRSNVHDANELRRTLAIQAASPGWNTDPMIANANLIIAGKDWAITPLLKLDSRFTKVYEDNISVLFEARKPAATGDASKLRKR